MDVVQLSYRREAHADPLRAGISRLHTTITSLTDPSPGISHIVCKRGAVSGADHIPAVGGRLLNASLQMSPFPIRITILSTNPATDQPILHTIPQDMPDTTIVLHQETKARLDELKRHPRETYNDVADRLVDMASTMNR